MKDDMNDNRKAFRVIWLWVLLLLLAALPLCMLSQDSLAFWSISSLFIVIPSIQWPIMDWMQEEHDWGRLKAVKRKVVRYASRVYDGLVRADEA